ncbi:MAG TPA: hypothetical protein VI112_02275 [Bacteroidia bacterium]|jgi:hypothetical protein
MNRFKKISYKKKNRLLLWGGLAVLFLIYKLTFSKTISLYFSCKELDQHMEMAANAPGRIDALEKESARLDRLLGKEQSDNLTQQSLLEVVTAYCQQNNILLKEFPQTLRASEKEYTIETNYFVMEGPFQKLLSLVYRLEQKTKTGKIASVSYSTRTDLRTKERILTATVFIRNIRRASSTAILDKTRERSNEM